MTTEVNQNKQDCQKTQRVHHRGGSDAVYGLGMIGAWIYFIGQATTFWMGVLGFLKGIVWPALVVLELLKYLKM